MINLENDDVLSVFLPGLESFRSVMWFFESFGTIFCVVGILLAVMAFVRGSPHVGILLFIAAMIVGASPKIARIFFF